MEKEKFIEEHCKLLDKYDVQWCWNCDLESIATGMMYYGKNPNDTDEYTKFLVTITGINSRGEGDLDGVLKLLEEELSDIYTREQHECI